MSKCIIFQGVRSRSIGIPLALLLVVFGLVLRIDLWAPMHSDDYSYTLKGISLAATIDHYQTWSGRLVADFLSSAILGLRSHTLSAVFNALAFAGLIGTIWWLPRFGTRAHCQRPGLALLAVFFAYWLGNAALGQTSFAIVGSANYLWTNVLQYYGTTAQIEQIRVKYDYQTVEQAHRQLAQASGNVAIQHNGTRP